jgi:D-alanyl-lipoteichoic acid acyltransferase DltB (MBOAT superfamily)
MVSALGYQLDYVTLQVVLPVGISFYTFQTLSYSIDAYRGKLKPTHSLLQLSAFVAFFPQLVAGPVERAANLLPQFQKPRVLLVENVKTGTALFIWGMFKKVFIADNLAPIVDHAFSNADSLGSFELFLGLLAFTFQIYCDFSGYSDMARGIARILGFNLMLNFNIPYISRTPSEFWQRWHISLSSWLRDYLYFSLGGNKGSSLLTYRNLCLTMLLGGLWHGASWTFVLWGAFHGTILVIYRILAIDDKLTSVGLTNNFYYQRLINLSSIMVMFSLTLIGWMIFRANTMDTLLAYTNNLFSFTGGVDGTAFASIAYYVWPLFVIQLIQIRTGKLEIFWDLPLFARLNIMLFLLLCIIFLQPSSTAAFIYFDF